MWNALKNLIGTRSTAATHDAATRRPSVSPAVESLEDRRLMSVSLVGSTLYVVGDNTPDSVGFGVIQSNGRYVYNVQGRVAGVQVNRNFELGQIRQVQFYGYGGTDSFENNSDRTCYMYGGADRDRLIGGRGFDVIYGEGGNDFIKDNTSAASANWDNYFFGGFGDDEIQGSAGHDVIYGGEGNDYLGGGDGTDAVYGEGGNDRIEGGNHNDYLYGGAGNDTLSGGSGSDWLFGQAGADILDGREGMDWFDRDYADRTDFRSWEDRFV